MSAQQGQAQGRFARLAIIGILTLLAFASNSILNRLALSSGAADPAAFAAVRTLSGALMLAALVLVRTKGLKLGGPNRISGTLSLTVYMLGFSYAYVALDAGLGALILFGGVQVTMFAAAVAGGEALPLRRWIGAVMAFGGLAWLVWPTDPTAPPILYAGLMGIAAIGWGIYSLVGRTASDPMGDTAANFVWATPLVAIAWVIAGDGMEGRGLLLAIIAGAITSGLGYTLWYMILPSLDRSVAAIAQLTVPVIALIGGVLFLNEDVTLRLVLASAVVLGGVALGAVSLPQRTSGSKGS